MKNGKYWVKGQIGLERFSYCTPTLKKKKSKQLRNPGKIWISTMMSANHQDANQFHCVVELDSCLSPGLQQDTCENPNGKCPYAIKLQNRKLRWALIHTRVHEDATCSLQSNGQIQHLELVNRSRLCSVLAASITESESGLMK